MPTVTSVEISVGAVVTTQLTVVADDQAAVAHTTKSTRAVGVASDWLKLRPFTLKVPVMVRALLSTPR